MGITKIKSEMMVSFKKAGVMKQGRGTCGTFKVINLTYLHVLHAGMVYITP